MISVVFDGFLDGNPGHKCYYYNNSISLSQFAELSATSGLECKSKKVVFPELVNCALIRELHVYGSTINVNNSAKGGTHQHFGIGQRLVRKAFDIAIKNGYKKIAVISGQGVKQYYEQKFGFREGEYFLLKDLPEPMISNEWISNKWLIVALLLLIVLQLNR